MSTERDISATSIEHALQVHQQEHDVDAAVAALVEQAGGPRGAPGFAARLASAGLDPSGVRGVADLSALPILSKDEAVEVQAQDPPFGGMLAAQAEVVRIFQSPGPLYEPQLAGTDSWRWGQALKVLGVGPEDLVLNCFGYHLSPAGAMMEAGAQALGARVLPGGIGNQDLQVRAIADLGVTAYTGLPSYLHTLIQRFEEAGFEPERWRLSKALVTAEPLPDSLRESLQQRVGWVQMTYGTGETGLLAYETDEGPDAGLALASGVLVQVCDLATGEPLTDDTQGQVVVTLLRPDYPLVRFGTGDLSAWMLGPDGRPRLRGVLGRVGAAVKVKGMFLHPAQVNAVLGNLSGLADYRLVIDRADHVDSLTAQIVPDGSVPGDDLAAEVGQRIRDSLRFRAQVELVAGFPEAEASPDPTGSGSPQPPGSAATGQPMVDLRDWS